MTLRTRLRVVERSVERFVRPVDPVPVGVCARIEELTMLYLEHPPALLPQVEAGILAAVEREDRYRRL